MRARSWILAVMILSGGCAPPGTDDAAPPASVAGFEQDEATWTRDVVEHREETDEEFRTSPTSPMAGVQRLQSDATERVSLVREDRTFALADPGEAGASITVGRQGSTWVWAALGDGVLCEEDGEAVVAGSALSDPATCTVAGFTVRVYPGEVDVIFTIYDPERPEKTSFEHLLYFPPDRGYAVPARLVKLEEPAPVEMLTSRSLKKTFYRYARIRFQLDGEDQELTAFKSRLDGEGSEYLFIPFRDATSGRETYGAGRFLDLDEPETEDFVLDFNRAYNPLCNYSPAYNCPIPPRENHLQVAVRAGELTYPH